MILFYLSEIDATNVKTLLVSFIGILLAFITALYLYFKSEVNGLKQDLKDERAYNKAQDNKNIETLIHVNNVLNQVTKQLEKATDNIVDVKNVTESIQPLIEANSERLRDIKIHLSGSSG